MTFSKLCAALVCLSMAACVPNHGALDYSPSDTVTSAESLKIAESYRKHVWTAKPENVCHGLDHAGVRVDTPDQSLKKGAAPRKGWWRENAINLGMPYKWGGFDTPASFDEKLGKGFYAGDVYTAQKRKALYDGVSAQACGIDCSGFISRCWKLDRAYSTRELPSICNKLDSFSDLKPGDLVNRNNVHALLFEGFVDESETEMLAYQTGSAPSWKVLRYKVRVGYLKSMGYKPYRYKNMQD